MAELLRFYPQGKYLYIEFMGDKYIAIQPQTKVESEELLNKIKPIVSQLDAFVESRNLKEIIEVNLKGVPISKLNSKMACEMLDLCMNIRPEKNLLEKIVITNANPIFNMIYKSVQTCVDPKIRKILSIESNSKFE